MRRLVHLSDLHFGRVDPAILEPITQFVASVKPDLITVSGDLTQRARSEEFIEARAFLDSLKFPQIVVPGNHDVPLHNIFARFFQSLDKYRVYINKEVNPVYRDDEIVVVGINTARSLTWKDGRISTEQIELMREQLSVPGNQIKIVMTHHPFDLPEGADGDVVGRSEEAMKALAECGVDIFLAGHFHIAHTGHTAKRYKLEGQSALVVSSGTSTSTRGRGEPNSLNVIEIEPQEIRIERWAWQPATARFETLSFEKFGLTALGWARL
ncbi:MAG: metallophosphoesterase [Verrucomicrobiota bacterium]